MTINYSWNQLNISKMNGKCFCFFFWTGLVYVEWLGTQNMHLFKILSVCWHFISLYSVKQCLQILISLKGCFHRCTFLTCLSLKYISRIRIKVLNTYVTELNIKIKLTCCEILIFYGSYHLNSFFLAELWCLPVMFISTEFTYLGICNWFNP